MNNAAEKRMLTCKSDLFDCLDQVRPFLEHQNVPQKAIYAAELTLEEIVTNVFRYGFDDPAEATVEVGIDLKPSSLTLHFEDAGKPFNSAEAAEPLTPASLAEAPIGGLGLKMVRKSVQSMQYTRVEGKNHLTVQIHFQP